MTAPLRFDNKGLGTSERSDHSELRIPVGGPTAIFQRFQAASSDRKNSYERFANRLTGITLAIKHDFFRWIAFISADASYRREMKSLFLLFLPHSPFHHLVLEQPAFKGTVEEGRAL